MGAPRERQWSFLDPDQALSSGISLLLGQLNRYARTPPSTCASASNPYRWPLPTGSFLPSNVTALAPLARGRRRLL